jgi:branched-chain amino acid transport system substrate-binding protein
MENQKKKISRRTFLKTGLVAGGLIASEFSTFPSRMLHAAPKEAKKVKEIYFACVEPYSGAAAAWHRPSEFSQQIFIEECNAKGGIKSLGGALLKQISLDTESSPEVAINVAERACNDPRVCAIVGTAQSAAAMVLTRIAEKYGVPVLMPEPQSPRLTARGFKYCFMVQPNVNVIIQSSLEGIAWLQDKATGKKVESMAVIFEDSEWGRSSQDAIKFFAPQYGLKAEYYPYSGLKDFDPFMTTVKAGNADLLYVATYPTHQILIVQSTKRINYNPLGFFISSMDEKVIDTMGKDAEYLFDLRFESHEAPGLPAWEKERFRQLDAKQEKLSGVKFDKVYGAGWNSLAILTDSLERCGKKIKDPTHWTKEDRKILRDAIAEVNLTAEKGNLYPWPVMFKSTGENATARATFAQIKKGGKRFIVFPEEPKIKEADVDFPVPPWDKR